MYFWLSKGPCAQKDKDIKALKNIFTWTVATLVVGYLLLTLLLSIPAVQRVCANAAEETLSKRLGTEVDIGHVRPGLPNRLILDDIAVYDQRDTLMLQVSRMAAKVEPWPLLKRCIRIRNAQLFGAQAVIYRTAEDEPLNCQFLIDAFASKDTTRHPIDLQIGSLLVRRSSLKYDDYSQPRAAQGFDPRHVHLSDISLNAQLRQLTPDSLNLTVKRLSMNEASGLQLERMETHIEMGPTQTHIPHLAIHLPHSALMLRNLEASHSESLLKMPPLQWIDDTEYRGEVSLTLQPSELAPFVPRLAKMEEEFTLDTPFEGHGANLWLPRLNLTDSQDNPLLSAAVSLSGLTGNPSFAADIHRLSLRQHEADLMAEMIPGKGAELAATLGRMLPLEAKGQMEYAGERLATDLQVQTEAGRAEVKGTMTRQLELDATLRAEGVKLAQILRKPALNDVGPLSMTSHVNGRIKDDNGRPQLEANGVIESLVYKGYPYHNVDFSARCHNDRYEANIGLQDRNGEAEIQMDATMGAHRKTLNCYAALVDFCPNGMNLTKRFAGEHFTLNLDAELEGSSIDDLAGRMRIENLCLHCDTLEDCLADHITLESRPAEGEQHLTIESPFMQAQMDGKFEWKTLPATVQRIMQAYLPSVFGDAKTGNQRLRTDDDMTFSAHIQDTTLLPRLLGQPIAIPHKATIDGRMEGGINLLTFNAQMPELRYGNESLRHIDCHMQTTEQNMQMSLLLERLMKGRPVELGVNAYSSDDQLRTRLHWNNRGQQTQIGEIDVTGRFYKDFAGQQAIRGDVNQSNLIVNDTIWTIHPAKFNYHDGIVELDSMRISKADKYLCINGRISENEQDTLVADLHEINLAYIFDLVNFHTVDFDGEATGRVYATGLRTSPRADAFLEVENLTFNGGSMGHMDVHGSWGAEEGSIYLDALMNDPEANHQTSVQGRITPGRSKPHSGIDLNIRTRRCNLYFLNKFTKSIFTNLQGRGTGWVRVYGPFKGINLEGDMVVDEASTHVNALNVDYHLAGDSVVLRPDNIWIRGARLYDKLGRPGMNEHCAIMDVHLMHNNLKHLRYDVQADARNVLGYDFRDFGDMSFYGTIFATGNIKLTGQSGELTADINGSPMPGSTLVYNSTSPETLTEAPFITYKASTTAPTDEQSRTPQTPEEEETTSDIRLNFNLDVTPDATLRVLMDARSGDYINLHGNGHILANYYNKGKFNMYGTYNVEDGIYKLSLQDIIHKDFQFQPGGTLSFGGNAQQASLNLKAVYTVPNVSIDDLSATSLGLSNTRVDCIMNITGRPLAPVVTFDFDLPNANEDEKEMVRQMVSTDEERNMQVIYLLGIGRFYNQSIQYVSAADQSRTAMNSLLSSTLSNQFNQIMSNVLGTDNWSFGANLRTGETGWDQTDVEGILSGRLLNNRLLINGNFGYRESYYSTNNFIGDFDVRYLLTRSGSLALKAYNQTNDRYFIQSSLTTQGIGLQIKKDFDHWRQLLPKKKKKKRK